MKLNQLLMLLVLALTSSNATAKLFGVDKILSDNQISINISKTENVNSTYKNINEDYLPTDGVLINNDSQTEIMNDESLRIQAYKYSQDGQDEKAIELYQRSLSQNQDNYKTWHGYAWSLTKLKRYNDAGRAYGQSINLGNNSETWRYLGWNYQLQGKKDEAIQCYETSLKINPKNFGSAHAYYALSKELFNNANSLHLVKASPTLRYRDYPDQDSNILGSVKNGETIEVIKESSEPLTIDGKSGRWVLIKQKEKDKYGYVFSGYLQKLKTSKNNNKKINIASTKSDNQNSYTIQLGAYSSNDNAIQFINDFPEKNAFIIPDKSNNRYITAIGHFSDPSEAEKYKNDLEVKYQKRFIVKSL